MDKEITIKEAKERLGLFYNEFCFWMRGKDMPYGGFYQKDIDTYIKEEKIYERMEQLK